MWLGCREGVHVGGVPYLLRLRDDRDTFEIFVILKICHSNTGCDEQGDGNWKESVRGRVDGARVRGEWMVHMRWGGRVCRAPSKPASHSTLSHGTGMPKVSPSSSADPIGIATYMHTPTT